MSRAGGVYPGGILPSFHSYSLFLHTSSHPPNFLSGVDLQDLVPLSPHPSHPPNFLSGVDLQDLVPLSPDPRTKLELLSSLQDLHAAIVAPQVGGSAYAIDLLDLISLI